MKKHLFLFTFGLCSLAYSQTTITKAFNDPVIGDDINNNIVNGTVDNSATGSGVTFSNPSVTMGAAANNTFVAPTSTEISTFPGTTIKQNDGNGTTLLFKTSATKLEITGVINSTATLNFSADNATYLVYPTTFGTTGTDNARGTFTSSLASGLFKGTITSTGDATGTLIIGTKSYSNILRVKIVQNFNLYQSSDTSYIFPIGSIVNTVYLYFDNIKKYPLLSYTEGTLSVPLLSINQTTSGAQAQNETFLGLQNNTKSTKLYPNPAQDFIRFEGLEIKNSMIEIYSTDGKLLKQTTNFNNFIDISSLSVGNYLLKVKTKEGKTETYFFIKQ